MFQEIFKGVNVLQQFSLRRQYVGVLEDVIADTQIFRYPAQVLEIKRFPFAGKVIESPRSLGVEDSLFRYAPKVTQAELSWATGSLISSGGLT